MKKMTVAQVMTRRMLTVEPDWSVDQLMKFFADHSISGAPVVEGDKPIGVVSLTDIARNGALPENASEETPNYYRQGLDRVVASEEMSHFHLEAESQTSVRDIMTRVVFAVEEDATVQEVAEMMITGRIHRVFVRSAGKLVGVVTSMDLLPLVRDMP
jgi:predicted transcriptional regulator